MIRYPSDPSPPPKPQLREHVDPDEKDRPLPWFVILAIGAFVMWGAFYISGMGSGLGSAYGDSRTPSALRAASAGPSATTGAATDGAQIYGAKCVACHQATGHGVPGVFPPLAGSEWVMSKDNILVQILLHGVNGPIQVKGGSYNGAMPSFGNLSDAKIAAVLSYVRQQWGNTAPAVSEQSVAAGRHATVTLSAPCVGGDVLKKATKP